MAMKLGEALLKESLITREQLKLALERQVIFGGRIGTNIVELGYLKEKDLLTFLSSFFGAPSVKPDQLSGISDETIACISKELAEKYKVVPFRKDRNRLHVAMLDPRDMKGVDELRFITRYDIIPYCVTELRLLYCLEKYYGTERDLRYITTFVMEDEETKPPVEKESHIAKVKEEFCAARQMEEIIGILFNESKNVANRAAVFVLKGNKISGLKGRGMNVEGFETVIVSPSIFSEILERKHYYRGPLLKIPGNETLISILSGTPQDCLLYPIQIRDKIIAFLYADNGNQAVLDASLSYINTLVAMASLSFEIMILRKKIMDL